MSDWKAFLFLMNMGANKKLENLLGVAETTFETPLQELYTPPASASQCCHSGGPNIVLKANILINVTIDFF